MYYYNLLFSQTKTAKIYKFEKQKKNLYVKKKISIQINISYFFTEQNCNKTIID